MIPTLEFRLKRGDTWRQVFTWRQGSETGPAVDLTGCSARLHLRGRGRALVLDCTPYLTLDAGGGSVTVTAPHEATAVLPVDTLSFDVELTFQDGSRQSTETMYLIVDEDETV